MEIRMKHSNTRLPKQLPPKTIIYESALLIRIISFILLFLFLFIFICLGFLFGLNRFQNTRLANMTSVAISVSTAKMALSQTAMPTKTPTYTPTATHTPTVTPTLTATPVYTWVKLLPDNSPETGPAFSLAIDTSDNIWLAYILDTTDDLRLSKFLRGTWRSFGDLSQLNKEGRSVGAYVNLNLVAPDLPQLAYLIYDKSKIRYSYLISDGTWSTQNVDQDIKIVDLKFVVDANQNKHFALLTESGDILYYSIVKRQIVDSKVVFPATFNNVKVGKISNPISMTVSEDGLVYICYSKNGEILCARGVDTEWEILDVGNGIFPSIETDSSGNLHLVYYDYNKKSLEYTIVPVNSLTPRTWVVDQSGDVGLHPSMTLDKNGNIHISYYDLTNSALKYAVGRNDGWSIFSLDNDGDVGVFSSIVVDSTSNPYIAYYSQSAQQLRFIYGRQ
jgi:hypothetical protein